MKSVPGLHQDAKRGGRVQRAPPERYGRLRVCQIDPNHNMPPFTGLAAFVNPNSTVGTNASCDIGAFLPPRSRQHFVAEMLRNVLGEGAAR